MMIGELPTPILSNTDLTYIQIGQLNAITKNRWDFAASFPLEPNYVALSWKFSGSNVFCGCKPKNVGRACSVTYFQIGVTLKT